MIGTVAGAAPWTKDAIRQLRHRYPDTLARIEAAIPADSYIVLTASRTRGPWGAVLMAGDDQAPPREVARTTGHPTINAACWGVLYAAGVTA